ncbi:hypothetical protein LAD77_01745 [Klebsiella pneumoniae]|nr:hypothetical protein [Klebsiella pneumoniae]
MSDLLSTKQLEHLLPPFMKQTGAASIAARGILLWRIALDWVRPELLLYGVSPMDGSLTGKISAAAV